MNILTIGGYGFDEKSFEEAIKCSGVDTFIDIRQRRGVRGKRYSFLNSSHLQKLLASIGVKYIHVLDLAPTADVRATQMEEDRKSGTAKRDRTHLSAAFTDRYRAEVLSGFNLESLKQLLRDSRVVILFCVEEHPKACHRLIAAEYLVSALGISEPVEHLTPCTSSFLDGPKCLGHRVA
mgnify:CR=1 FL=1